MTEDRRSDPNAGGTELDRGLEIPGHAHGELFDATLFRQLGEQSEMRTRVFIRRRNAHQAFYLETKLLTAETHETGRLLRFDAGLLRLQPGIHLDIETRRPALLYHFVRQRTGDFFTVYRLDY